MSTQKVKFSRNSEVPQKLPNEVSFLPILCIVWPLIRSLNIRPTKPYKIENFGYCETRGSLVIPKATLSSNIWSFYQDTCEYSHPRKFPTFSLCYKVVTSFSGRYQKQVNLEGFPVN